MKNALILLGVLLLWWILDLIASSYLHSKTEAFLKDKQFSDEFLELQKRWSNQSKKESLKKIENLFALYSIKPKVLEQGGIRSYEFVVTKESSEIISSILAEAIEINRFSFNKLDELSAKVSLEIKL